MKIRLLLLARADLRATSLVALWGLLAMGLGVMVWPGEALAWTGQPLAYVTSSDGISVIDTEDNRVVDTIPGNGDQSLNDGSRAIAANPDGSTIFVITGYCPFPFFACHPEAVYYAFWVIDTATHEVVSTSFDKGITEGIAFTPDGQQTYLANFDPYTALPQVLAFGTGNVISLPGNGTVYALAITPDGRHAYVPYVLFDNGEGSENVAIIDTASNTVKTIGKVIDGVRLEARIELRGDFSYAFHAEAKGANLSGATNPTQVSLAIGDDAGLTSVKAHFYRDYQAHHWTDYWR
jgi:hypothetical protein